MLIKIKFKYIAEKELKEIVKSPVKKCNLKTVSGSLVLINALT